MKLAAGSTSAFKTLHELNISNLLKDVLSASDISLGMSSPHLASAHVQVRFYPSSLHKEIDSCIAFF